MESDLGERVFAAERITKKRLRKGKGKSFDHFFKGFSLLLEVFRSK